jgi:hypothetical protein
LGTIARPNERVNTANSEVLPVLSVAVSASCAGTLPRLAEKLPFEPTVTATFSLSRPWPSFVTGLAVKIWMVQLLQAAAELPTSTLPVSKPFWLMRSWKGASISWFGLFELLLAAPPVSGSSSMPFRLPCILLSRILARCVPVSLTSTPFRVLV